MKGFLFWVLAIVREATAPLVSIPEEKLVEFANPNALMQRAEELETVAKELTYRLGEVLNQEAFVRLIKPTLDGVVFLREVAGKIGAIEPKA